MLKYGGIWYMPNYTYFYPKYLAYLWMFITRFLDFGALNPVISCFVLRRAPRVKRSQKRAKKGQNRPNQEDDTT